MQKPIKQLNPKKANCIILFKDIDTFLNYQNYDYETLFLQRQRKMTFGNMWSFPGGKEDPIDYTQFKIHNVSPHQQCAIRETYEETGILLLPKQVQVFQNNDWLTILKLIAKRQLELQKNNKNFDEFTFLQNTINEQFCVKNLRNIQKSQEIIDLQSENSYGLFQITRFLTPAQERLPKRFDTRFFGFKLENGNYLNWNNFIHSYQDVEKNSQLLNQKCLLDLQKLQVSQGEVKRFQWFSPSTGMSSYLQEKIKWAYPQFHIMNLFSSFKKIEDLKREIKKIEQWSFQNRDQYDKYEIQYNSIDFPIVPQFNVQENLKLQSRDPNTDMLFVAIYPGDSDFDFEQYYGDEEGFPQEHLTNFVQKYYGKINQEKWKCLNNNNQGKLFFKNLKNLQNINHNYQARFKYDFPNLLNFMNNQEQIEQLIGFKKIQPKL